MSDLTPTICAICQRLVAPGQAYVVRIEVFAEPAAPPLDTDGLTDADLRAQIAALIAQLAAQSPAQAQDAVHRRMSFTICGVCQPRYLENPLPALGDAEQDLENPPPPP